MPISPISKSSPSFSAASSFQRIFQSSGQDQQNDRSPAEKEGKCFGEGGGGKVDELKK